MKLATLRTLTTNERIEILEEELLKYPQIDCPLTHNFTPGLYLRTILMPAGSFIIGHEHLTEHFNIIHTGRASVMIDGDLTEIWAPNFFASKPGIRKVLLIHEDMRWSTTHVNPDDEMDIAKLEDRLIKKSGAFLRYEERLRLEKAAKEALQ